MTSAGFEPWTLCTNDGCSRPLDRRGTPKQKILNSTAETHLTQFLFLPLFLGVFYIVFINVVFQFFNLLYKVIVEDVCYLFFFLDHPSIFFQLPTGFRSWFCNVIFISGILDLFLVEIDCVLSYSLCDRISNSLVLCLYLFTFRHV